MADKKRKPDAPQGKPGKPGKPAKPQPPPEEILDEIEDIEEEIDVEDEELVEAAEEDALLEEADEEDLVEEEISEEEEIAEDEIEEEIAEDDELIAEDDDIEDADEEDAEVEEEIEEDADEELIEDADEEELVEDADEEEAVEDADEEVVEDADEEVVEDADEEVVEDADEEVVEDAEEEVVEDADEEVVADADEEVAADADADVMSSFAGLNPDLSYAGIAADDEEAVVDEDAVVDEEAADEDDEDEVLAGPPRPKLSILNLVLILLNFIGVGAFLYFLVEDYTVRNVWSYAILKVDLAYFGLPSEEEERGPTTDRINLAKVKVSPELLKFAHTKRGGTGDAFPNTEFLYRPRIKPSELREDMLKDHFQLFESKNAVISVPGTGLITSLEKEMAFVKTMAWPKMNEAAKEYVDALKDADKKPQAINLFFSLAPDLARAQKIEKTVNAADPKLAADLCQEAALRRMAFDVLAPLELYRPGELNTDFLSKIGDIDFPIAKIKERVEQRIDASVTKVFDPNLHLSKDWEGLSRNTLEKRQTTAFTMICLAQTRTPAPARKLVFPTLLARAQCVVGLFDFANVVPDYLTQHRHVEEKWLQAIQLERKTFVDEYQALVNQIVNLIPEIDHQAFTNLFLTASNAQYQNLVKTRSDDVKLLIEKIVTARRESAKTMSELEEMQKQLFEAQVRLATAEQENYYLETVIARAQRALKGVKK